MAGSTSDSSSSLDARVVHPALEGVASGASAAAGECEEASALPMLSPDECFERVEMRFRSMLRKRHVPLGIIANLEEDLTGFFRCVEIGIFWYGIR